jgi:outer membrane assembly lipoprotein YfiO
LKLTNKLFIKSSLLIFICLTNCLSGCSLVPSFLGGKDSDSRNSDSGVSEKKVEESVVKAEPHQISESYQIVSEQSIARELAQAKELYEKKLYTLASNKFRTIRDSLLSGDNQSRNKSFPQFIQLKLADSLFFSQDFTAAIIDYNKFLAEYSDSPDVPYVLFQIGHANQLLDPGVGRDNTYIEKAVNAYEKVWKKYSKSMFARQALEHYLECRKNLQEHNELISDYYAKITAGNALKARLKSANLSQKELGHEIKSARIVLNSAPTLEKAREIHFSSKKAN